MISLVHRPVGPRPSPDSTADVGLPFWDLPAWADLNRPKRRRIHWRRKQRDNAGPNFSRFHWHVLDQCKQVTFI